MSIPTISPARIAELTQDGKAIDLIDVRTPSEFQAVHLAFARNIPLDQLDVSALIQTRNGAGSEPFYIVCHSGARGRQACEKFLKAGFSNVLNIEGGTTACVDAGLPVVRGKKGLPLDRQVRIVIGAMALLGAVFGWFVHPYFIGLSAFAGAGLIFAGITDACPLAMIMAKMPWNQGDSTRNSCCTR